MAKIIIILTLIFCFCLSIKAENIKPDTLNSAPKIEIKEDTKTTSKDTDNQNKDFDHFIDKDGDGIADNRNFNRLNSDTANKNRRIERIQIPNPKGSRNGKNSSSNRTKPLKPGQGTGGNNPGGTGHHGSGNGNNGG